MSFSSFRADILTVADANDWEYYLKLSYDSIFIKSKMRHHRFVDSRGFFDTIITVNDPWEYRLKITVAKIRESFESGESKGVNWIHGRRNLADALTKWDAEASKCSNEVLNSGSWDENIDSGGRA